MQNLSGDKILDVGCGPGRDSKYFSEHGFDVTGIDLTPSFVRIASHNVPTARFFQMDMRELTFPKGSFDGLWVCASFFHIPKKDAKSTLLKFKKLLRTKGLIYISVKEGIGEKIIQKREDHGHSKFYAYYTLDEFKNLIEASGFKIIRIIVNHKVDIDNPKIKNTWIHIFATKSLDE